MLRDRIFISVLIGFLAGVFVGTLLTSEIVLVFFALALSLLLVVTSIVYGKGRIVFVVAFLILGFSAGIVRVNYWKQTTVDTALILSLNKEASFIGVVSGEPDVRESRTSIPVDLNTILGKGGTTTTSGRILLAVNRYPEYEYGDIIKITGKLQRPEAFAGDDGRIFKYPHYLSTKDIYFTMYHPHISVVETKKGSFIYEKLFAVKHRFLESIAKVVPEPENSLLSGVLLGSKALGKEWMDRFRVVGLVHIVVLSGYNMTIVAQWLSIFFRFLGFYGRLGAGALGIILFAMMSGGGATVMRAAIMALLALLARSTGRTYTMSRALLLAGVLMVMQKPSILSYDPSFQLSFLAALGLVFVGPIFDERLTWFRNLPMFREIFIATVSTQIFVLPLLLFQTGLFSLVAVPVNMLVLPLIPATMLLGFITGFAGLFSSLLAIVPGTITYLLLAYTLKITEIVAQLPFASIYLPPLSPLVLFVLYIVVAGGVWLFYFRKAKTISHQSPRDRAPLGSPDY